jgi:putative ABC transport system substrate-binding protein
MNNRRKLLVALAASSVASVFGAHAQTQSKLFRIGYLATSDPATTPQLDEFREGLRERGYVEGKNLSMEYRWAEGSIERHPELATELVRLKVDVIFAWGTPAVTAAKQATSTIPIVMVGVGDPVGSGFVASLARPGGNITGLSNIAGDLTGKLVELLSQAVPGIKRVAVLRNPANALAARQMKDAETSARSLGLQLQAFDARGPADFEDAYASMAKARAIGVVVLADPMLAGNPRRLAELANKFRTPSIYAIRTFPEAGGLMSYGPPLDVWRLAASYVDKIFRGAKPADLPVEQPTMLELVINVKTAKALGIKFPQSILVRADKVIE